MGVAWATGKKQVCQATTRKARLYVDGTATDLKLVAKKRGGQDVEEAKAQGHW